MIQNKKSKINKKAQTTIFVLIGVLIVAVAILIYFFFPQALGIFSTSSEDPYAKFQICLEDEVRDAVTMLSMQGGSIDPEHYIVYNGENVEYLCYTNEFYKECVVQQPLLKEHVEKELAFEIRASAKECLNKVKESFENNGYQVTLREGEVEAELLPKRIIVRMTDSMTANKGGSETFDEFRIVINNNLYELISISNSIIEFETRYGDSETTTYMNYYHDLKVEKKKQIEGSTIYILTDRNNLNSFQFASRSIPWPTGYT